ncbi:sulfite exporter TauE/SafE family protein [Nanchangia anserum]|uniref:Sulfite exporter TauE/SafE family protein n=1 Tax=Nanchangia anserum TaxID=2692125 RepID=A0A8I0GG08_9ACTO|nr:cytochrome c biogenesis protein CcdA [Nanchangia anserum]MBD3690147.1 sulfite exporter TauE/SafE family protein [Nanchangia anserum]QOX82074.1 sulfite exporter TauE/SafE family protein [Nanchangia anserum]
MIESSLSLPLAFGAGILAFVSPCFLPLVPVTLTILAYEEGNSGAKKWMALRRAVVFVVGFSLVFTMLWLAVAAAGPLIASFRTPVRLVAGAIGIVMGFHVAGLVRIPVLDRTMRADVSTRSSKPGWLRAALLGMTFGAGWSPCIGPVLGGIITLAASTGSLVRGGALMVAFCVGLGIPFLAMAMGLGASGRLSRWLGRHHRGVSLMTGLLLVVTGLLIMTNSLETLGRFLPVLT